MFSNEGFRDGLWFMNPMTAEDLQQQKLRELLIELPSTPEEMWTFLSPENLNRNHLPFPASDFNPVLSLPENNNRSETLELLSNQALSFSFLIETTICSQKPKSKAPKGFQALVAPKVTEQD
ncbi:hypothetical protein WKK05_39285 (plasmid) [Nostoc sp. UHCC 0302]|uniref:hypothetical protein n=1 Tax=Nostoc sp. UHCC 0302 TaxID=3134896 RepID=UPI00311CE13E